jgi:hypothetical protein
MRNWDLTRANILAAQVPQSTETYTAIPHSVFLNEIQEELYKKDYIIHSESYLSTQKADIVTGNFTIKKAGDVPNAIAPAIYFVNSYNKMRRATIKAGVSVLVCKNGMMGLAGGSHFNRKHSGSALEEIRTHISHITDKLEEEYGKLELNMREMQQIELDNKLKAQLVGDMLINEALITSTQLGILQKELKFSKEFKDNSLWSFYNHCTEAFKDSHPLYYDKQHVKFHTYITDKFELTGHRGLYGGALEVADIVVEDLEFAMVD